MIASTTFLREAASPTCARVLAAIDTAFVLEASQKFVKISSTSANARMQIHVICATHKRGRSQSMNRYLIVTIRARSAAIARMVGRMEIAIEIDIEIGAMAEIGKIISGNGTMLKGDPTMVLLESNSYSVCWHLFYPCNILSQKSTILYIQLIKHELKCVPDRLELLAAQQSSHFPALTAKIERW
jgi:hypothetical protein